MEFGTHIRVGVVACLLAAAPARVFAGQSAPPLTLDAAMQRAITANHTIAAARLGRAVNVAGVSVAAERLNPEITFDWEKETPRQAISGVIPIELGGKRGRRIDLAQAAVATSDAALNQLIALIKTDVRRAYFQAVAAERRLALAEDIRGIATRARDAARSRFAAGDVPELEAVQTELALAETENEVIGARGEITATRAGLNALLGQAPDTAWVLADDLTTGDLPAPDAAVARALGGNLELALIDRRIVEQQMRRAVAKSLQTPDLAAGSSLTYDAQPEFRIGWRLSFSMTVPVFTQHKAGVVFEDAELTRLGAERDAIAATIAADVVAAVARASAARDQLRRFQTESLPRVVVIERMAQDGYNAGQTGLVVLLQAFQQTREVRRRGLQAALDFQSALADLERAIGVR